LRAAGWTDCQNLQVDVRFGTSAQDRIQRDAEELLSLKPNVVLAQGVVGAGVLRRLTTTAPVVFVQVQDPVGGGFVTNLARPDGAPRTGRRLSTGTISPGPAGQPASTSTRSTRPPGAGPARSRRSSSPGPIRRRNGRAR
jgi:hypothetical protein